MARGRGSERGRPGLHSEHARDVETLARHARHAVARLCARSATMFTERYRSNWIGVQREWLTAPFQRLIARNLSRVSGRW
jgi:hypothetical protein